MPRKPQAKDATSGTRLAAAERRERCVALRLGGLPIRAIAAELRCSPGAVHAHLVHVLAEHRAGTAELVEQYRAVEGARLEELHRAVWPAAVAGDLAAAMVALRIMERRARLFGLDAPTRVEAAQTEDVVLRWVGTEGDDPPPALPAP